jgi:hypothetical protein
VLLTERELLEHVPGCVQLPRFNCSATHRTVQKALEALAGRAGVSFVDEPRYAGYAPPARNRGFHELGPDITFHLPHALTVDLKGVNPACKSNLPFSLKKLFDRKARDAAALYRSVVEGAGEEFRTVCFTYHGGLASALVKVVDSLINESPDRFSRAAELTRLTVSIARGVGRSILHYDGLLPGRRGPL